MKSFERLQQYKFVLLGMVIVVATSFIGVVVLQSSQAATGGSMYMTPASGKVVAGSNLTLTVRENSGQSAANAVQTIIKYSAKQLQFVSVRDAGIFTQDGPTDTATPGVVKVARFISGGTATGDQPVATLTFKVLASSGTAKIMFDRQSSFVAQASDGSNIVSSTGFASGRYKLAAVPEGQ